MKYIKHKKGISGRTLRRAVAGTRKIMAALLAASALLGGCSKDEPADNGSGEAVQFKAGIQAVSRTTNGGDSWTTGDKVGIYMVSENGGLPGDILTVGGVTATNREYNVTPATGELTPQDGGALYYPQSGAVDFIAYYPYTGTTGTGPGQITADGKYNLTVAGQTYEQAQNGLDVLYAKTSGVAKTKTAVGLDFAHVLSKVTFNVTLGDGLTGLDGTYITATAFSGMPLTASLELGDGTLTAGQAGDFSALKMATAPAGTLASFTALIVPQPSGGSGRTVTFTVDGEPYYWNIPDGETFAAAGHYTYPVTVKKSGVVVGQRDISPWTQNDNGSGDAGQIIVQPEANSYMVTPGGPAILIPVSQANRVLTADGLGAATDGLGGVTADNYTVELVWADLPVGAGGVIREMFAHKIGDKGYIYVEPGVAGNAVICIKDKDTGAIKWSWHIWVTEPVTYATDTETGLTWMDRNLGATANTPLTNGTFDQAQWVKTLGLFYQWGRKDAFPGSDGMDNNQTYFTPEATGGTTDYPPTGEYTELPGMVQNPLGFATNNNTFYGSINHQPGNQNNSWGGVSGDKSIYDPCPPGWKVPPATVNGNNTWGSDNNAGWEAFTNQGRVFNGVNGIAGINHFYPASGNRHYITGMLYYAGAYGWFWSGSSYSASYGWHLDVHQSYASQYGATRSYGFTVRCVRE